MMQRVLSALALTASLGACAAEPPAGPATAANTANTASVSTGAATPGGVEAVVRAAMAEVAPGNEIAHVRPSPIPGYQEVAMGARVVYVSNDGKYLVQGMLFDIAARENLTQASEAVVRKDLLADVGPERRIVFAAAEPKHRVTVFTDIDCGYCRRMHEQMADYNRLGISIEYLFFPREGIGSEGFEKAVSVWCAPDRQAALTAAKSGQALPKGSCGNPVTEDYALGRKVGLDGTPAMYSAEGVVLGGYVEPVQLLARLEELAAKPAK